MKYQGITGNIAVDMMLNCIDFYKSTDKKLKKMIFRDDYYAAISAYVEKHIPGKQKLTTVLLFEDIEIVNGGNDLFEPMEYEFTEHNWLKGL